MPFQATSDSRNGRNEGQHHIPLLLPAKIRFAMCGFQSLLLTASQLISFPAGTETLHFPAFPILADSLRKSYSEISGSTSTCDSPEHFAACRVLHRQLSRVIHLTASLFSFDGLMNINRTTRSFNCGWHHHLCDHEMDPTGRSFGCRYSHTSPGIPGCRITPDNQILNPRPPPYFCNFVACKGSALPA